MKSIITYILLFITAISMAQTNREYLEQGLIELGLDSVQVMIRPLNNDLLEGRILGHNGQYVLQLNKSLYRGAQRRVIAHELIHIWQYETKKLNTIDPKRIIYDGKEYKYSGAYYRHSRWEREAYSQGYVLSKKIRRALKTRNNGRRETR